MKRKKRSDEKLKKRGKERKREGGRVGKRFLAIDECLILPSYSSMDGSEEKERYQLEIVTKRPFLNNYSLSHVHKT